ncbi:MAG: hypothetical protein GXN93_00085 [Candidatus Diapherotrites archaeon]|nr:hypothetical protein [Candidatus Diapherotrites archaeon]
MQRNLILDYKNGRLVLGSYGGSVGPREAEQAAVEYARKFNEQLDSINKKHSEELSRVHLLPRVSRINEIIVGDESGDFETYVVHPREILPFYGDYLDKAHRGDRVESIVYGRRRIVD